MEDDKKLGNCSIRILSRNLQPGIVGLDTERLLLLKWLDATHDGLRDVPFVEMAGIGKTTLVQQICDDSYVGHFKTCLMVTIGPNYTLREFLLLVLDHLALFSHEIDEKLGDEELGNHLRKFFVSKLFNCIR